MGKILGSWSGMRKYLEKDILADCLQGRIRYECTTYVGMGGCRIFKIFADNQIKKKFSWETVNSHFNEDDRFQKGKELKHPITLNEYWTDFSKTLFATPICERDEYTDREFCEALAYYRQQKIDDSIYSENPIVRMFAVMDRRLGKRTLLSIKNTVSAQPEWLQFFYNIRLQAENLL